MNFHHLPSAVLYVIQAVIYGASFSMTRKSVHPPRHLYLMASLVYFLLGILACTALE